MPSPHPLHSPFPISLWTENKVDAEKNLTAFQILLCLTFTRYSQNAEFSQLFSSKQLQCKLPVHVKRSRHSMR